MKTKEKILKESYKSLIKYLDWNVDCEKEIKEILNKAIDQTREDTIKDILKEIRDYIKDNEKLGYENRILAADEIYAKISIILENYNK